MKNLDPERLLRETGALCRGHFLLSSGLHSDQYCQCARLFEHPEAAGQLASAMAEKLEGVEIDIVLAPALGGVLWGYELARALGARSLFAERPAGGAFGLRRGFSVGRGECVLLAEDVVTTGGSVMELVPLVESNEARLAGFAAVVDRSRGTFQPGLPFYSLLQLEAETYKPEDCHLCREGKPVEKPGSRARPR